MKKNDLGKIALSMCVSALLFTSCQKEDVNEEVNVDAAQLEEAPFKNYIVISASSTMTKSVENFLKTSGGEIISSTPEIGISVVSSKDANFIGNTMKNQEVASVVPDYEIQWIPSDNAEQEVTPPSIGNAEPFYGYLWGMDAIDAPQAWNAGFTGKGASVFVLDSGIDAEQGDLSPNLNTSLSASFVPGEDWNIREGRYFNHGTHVAGTIAAAQNNYGVIGVAPDAELVAVKVLSEYSGSGAFSWINAGIVHAANKGADIVNMSLGGTVNKNGGYIIDADGKRFNIPADNIQALILAQQRAVDYAFSKGVTIIASAGNDGVNYDGNTSYLKLPAGLNNVISISATAPEGWNFDPSSNYDVPSSYTTHGRSLIDLAAPGGDGDVSLFDMIVSPGSGGGYYFSAGTSMAAPHVSGVAALIIAKNGGQMDPYEVEQKMINTADKVGGNGNHVYFGKGRINAHRAVTE